MGKAQPRLRAAGALREARGGSPVRRPQPGGKRSAPNAKSRGCSQLKEAGLPELPVGKRKRQEKQETKEWGEGNGGSRQHNERSLIFRHHCREKLIFRDLEGAYDLGLDPLKSLEMFPLP